MPGLGEDEPRLAALDPEAAAVHLGVIGPPVRRVGVHLGVQRLVLVRVRGRLPAVEQLERQAGRGHGHCLPGPNGCETRRSPQPSSTARSSMASRAGSAMTSIREILSSPMVKASAMVSRPRGAITMPGVPLTRATRAYLERTEAAARAPLATA